jgi:hypothetical protein
MWFDDFPKQCPPSDARQDTLEVFRLVSNIPPTEDDFRPNIREFPHQPFRDDVLCYAHGVSVYKKYEDVLNTRENKRNKRLRDKKIAVGTITPKDGVIKETFAPSHVTWWLQTDEPHKTFKEVQDVTK